LNSEDGVADTEAFLPRLYWTAALVVESAGGRFIKWTGDGFLAWFETPLHRDLRRTMRRCLDAVWHLTVMVNATQLGLSPKTLFKIRHGLAYEQDALLTKIIHPGGFESLDLVGRAVVLAFRLSGITANFPGIIAQREIVEAATGYPALEFRGWVPTAEERLKYFKGEKWGTHGLSVSGRGKPRARSRKVSVNLAKLAIQKAEGQAPIDDAQLVFSKTLHEGMMAGPEWSRKVETDYMRFNEDLLGSVKLIMRTLESTPK
jgi:hypothetical protein